MQQTPTNQDSTIPKRFFYNELLICFDEALEATHYYTRLKVENSNALQSEIAKCLQGIYTKDVCLYGYDIPNMYKDFKAYFKFMRASGGLVQNQNGEFLFIKRFGIWDLPKGKLKKTESVEMGAIREVVEETGINEPTIVRALPSTYHIYKEKEKFILKETNWFLMQAKDQKNLIPQIEEDITAAEWLTKYKAKKAIAQSYRSLRDSLGNQFND